MAGYADWVQITGGVNPLGTGVAHHHNSAVLLPDGRVLYVYTDGAAARWPSQATVRQGYFSSVDDFTSGAGAIQNVTDISTGTLAKATVFHIGSRLMLALFEFGLSGTPGWLKLYESPSGLGGDWVEFSTVESWTYGWTGSYGFDDGRKGVSAILVASAGNWIIAYPRPFDYYRYPREGLAFAYSSDGGVTWSRTFFYTNGYVEAVGRSLAEINNKVYVSWSRNYGGLPCYLHPSTDGVATWALEAYYDTETNNSYANGAALLNEEDQLVRIAGWRDGVQVSDHMYVMRADPSSDLQAWSSWEEIHHWPNKAEYSRQFFHTARLGLTQAVFWSRDIGTYGMIATAPVRGILAPGHLPRVERVPERRPKGRRSRLLEVY